MGAWSVITTGDLMNVPTNALPPLNSQAARDPPPPPQAPGMSGPWMLFICSAVVITICVGASGVMEGRTALYDLLAYICPYAGAITAAFAFNSPIKGWEYAWVSVFFLAAGLFFYILSKHGWSVPAALYMGLFGVTLCGIAIYDDIENIRHRRAWHDKAARIAMPLAMVLFLVCLYLFVPPADRQNACEIAVTSPTKIMIEKKAMNATGNNDSRSGEVVFEGKLVIRASPCVVTTSP